MHGADRSNGMTAQIGKSSTSSFAIAYRLTRPKVRTKPWPDAPIFDRDYAMMLVALRPGISDREIAEAVYGPGSRSDIVAETCRALASEKAIGRRLRRDGVFGNYLAED